MSRIRPFRWILGLCAVSLAGCSPSESLGSQADKVRFDLRPFSLKRNETEFSTAFSHESVIVASGDSAAARRPYLILLSLTRGPGGDPNYPLDKKGTFVVVVNEGSGDVAIAGGSRNKKTTYQAAETWEVADVSARIIGYVPFVRVGH